MTKEKLLDRLKKSGVTVKEPKVNYSEKPALPKGKLNKRQQWQAICWNIDTMETSYGKSGLKELALGYLRILQGTIIASLLMDTRPEGKGFYSYQDLLWGSSVEIGQNGLTLATALQDIPSETTISLTYDLVIPQPWENNRILRSLASLGDNKSWGKWEQTDNLHAEIWHPWPIAWVSNGNHSTLAALITHGGNFKANVGYEKDASGILKSVKTDGLKWERVDNGKTVGSVNFIEMAAIFEIGRRLLDIKDA